MPSLHETQARVMDALRRRSDALPAAPLLRRSAGLAAERRLQVYRHNIEASLGTALAAVYPVLARLVGETCFASLARAYAARHPSRSGHLHPFGAEMAGFVAAQDALAGLPYLADVAALEWAVHEVHHEGDDLPFEVAALAAVPIEAQPRLCLQLQHASRFVASPFPVLAIWQANQPDIDFPPTVSLADGGLRLLVGRRGFEVEFRHLDDAEDRWLRELARGRSLADASAAALAIDPVFDLGATLGRHLALGSFRSASLDAESTA